MHASMNAHRHVCTHAAKCTVVPHEVVVFVPNVVRQDVPLTDSFEDVQNKVYLPCLIEYLLVLVSTQDMCILLGHHLLCEHLFCRLCLIGQRLVLLFECCVGIVEALGDCAQLLLWWHSRGGGCSHFLMAAGGFGRHRQWPLPSLLTCITHQSPLCHDDLHVLRVQGVWLIAETMVFQ